MESKTQKKYRTDGVYIDRSFINDDLLWAHSTFQKQISHSADRVEVYRTSGILYALAMGNC